MEQNTQHVTNEPLTVALDQCKVAFLSAITENYVHQLITDKNLPQTVNVGILKATRDHLKRTVKEMRRTTIEHKEFYLDRNLKKEKLADIATMVQVLARIGEENGGDMYEEFLGLFIDIVDAIFYSQQNRSKIHFSKYKALFQLMERELRADVNETTPQMVFRNRELYIRTNFVQPPTKVG